MKCHKVSLTINSPLMTPLLADTLFGHICWGIVLHDGEKRLHEFLESSMSTPPLLALSNAMPKGMLPFPILRKTLTEYSHSTLEEIHRHKRLKKIRYLPAEILLEQRDTFSIDKLMALLFSGKESNTVEEPAAVTVMERKHNTVNRLSGSTLDEVGLFAVRELWYPEPMKEFEVYAVTSLSEDELFSLFSKGLQFGFGADRSTGRGDVRPVSIETVELPNTGNRGMAMAHFVPGADDVLQDLRADIFTKYGKLGEHFVHEKNPFKKPIVMYREGATWDAEDTSKGVCGSLIEGVHSDERIKQHAYTPVLYFHEESGR